LDEFKNLRITIREELEAAFRNDDMRQLKALRKSAMDTVLGIRDTKHIPEKTVNDLESYYRDIKTMMYKLQEYGYATYAAVAVGAMLSLSIGILLKQEKGNELLSVFNNMMQYFTDAIAPDPAKYQRRSESR
jgi:hypothetical protein